MGENMYVIRRCIHISTHGSRIIFFCSDNSIRQRFLIEELEKMDSILNHQVLTQFI